MLLYQCSENNEKKKCQRNSKTKCLPRTKIVSHRSGEPFQLKDALENLTGEFTEFSCALPSHPLARLGVVTFFYPAVNCKVVLAFVIQNARMMRMKSQ